MISDDTPIGAPPRRRNGLRTIAVIVVVAFLAGLLAMGFAVRHYHWFAGSAATTAATGTPPQSARTALAPASAPNGVTPVADLDTLAAREAALAARISDLETRTATVDTQASAASGNATRAEGLLIAFAARRALDRGLGLGYIEVQLRERFGATQPRSVATIIQASRAPVTIEDLRLGLSSIAPDLVTGPTNAGWGPSLKSAFSNLIVLHKEDSPSPRPSDRLERARRMLEGGQVEAALAEVARLPGAAKADAWTSAARRYVDSRHALDVIETAAIMGQASRPGAPADAAAGQGPSFEVGEPDSGAGG